MSQVIKSLPKVHDSGKHSAVVPTGHAGGSGSQPSQLPSDSPQDGPQTSVHNTFEYHDQRSQQVRVGVDPMVFSTMVFEARRVIESEEKAQGLEQFAQEVYQQACIRIQELVDFAERLCHSDCSKTSEIERLQRDVQSTRDQFQIQINRNQTMESQITQFESQMSNVQNLFGQKDAEITRLMSEVSRLRSNATRLEERLAAVSAARTAAATSMEAQVRSAQVDVTSGNLGLNDGSDSVFVRQNDYL